MRQEILKTLAYADIFDYPLTISEIWEYLISSQKISQKEIKNKINSLPEVSQHKEFYCLKNREEIVDLRLKRGKWCGKKMVIAKKAARLLSLIPFVRLIGITGALAMNNASQEDDIDFLIITSKNRLWLTRGLVVILLKLAGLYRRPDKINNMICPNMFLDEKYLSITKKEQDLYLAHEVLQLKPIIDKDNYYNKFLKANLWATKYLANWKN